ncbi:MAG: conjugal transfer protein TraX [Defluviitaleaceae bacterium]|nr:conjugal transfer protein TraX [Defluviitaleaceae bacterium]
MSASTLKLIAVASMLVDHVGAVLLMPLAQIEEYAWIFMLARFIGRMAFPIFAFLIAQGCLHTKNIKAYATRLGALALISQIPFDLALGRPISFLQGTNVFYTLFLAVCAIAVYKALKSRRWAIIVALPPFAFLAHQLSSDFGAFGVIMIFMLYYAAPASKHTSAAVIAAFMLYLYLPRGLGFLLFGVSAALLVLLYNGKRGLDHPLLKYGFYAFYPLHLAVLALL